MKDSNQGNQTSTLANSSEEKENCHEEPDKLEQNNIVTSLAEKAMSVAGPVVPVKEDGGVDQDRSNQLFRLKPTYLISLSQTHSLFPLSIQAGGITGSIGTKGWHVEAGWQSCFALGWYTGCY